MGTTSPQPVPDAEFNSRMAVMFRRAAALLEAQHADRFRVLAYRHGADELESLTESAADIYRRDGLWGLIALPAIGRSLALAIADVAGDGHWHWLDRLEGDTDPEKVLATLPTIGPKLARRLHLELGIESLDDLERAIYNGRLGRLRGIGDKRWHAIRDSVVARLHRREQHHEHAAGAPVEPEVELLLSIDDEYRAKADQNLLPTIAPRRFNPTGAHWLPVLHTTRDEHHFTAMFSNTARAHELGRTDDWVVIFADWSEEDRWTVVTETQGPHRGERVVRGHALRLDADDRSLASR